MGNINANLSTLAFFNLLSFIIVVVVFVPPFYAC